MKCGQLFWTKYAFKIDCGKHSQMGQLIEKKKILDRIITFGEMNKDKVDYK